MNDELNMILYNKLINKGVKVYCIKTDAFYVDKSAVNVVKEMGIIGTEIGQYKISKKKLCMPMTGFIKRYNELIPLCVQGFETVLINDEYDTEEITGHIQNGGVVCKGAGGTGKSYGASKVNLNKLWITPNNLLAQEKDGEAITFTTFFFFLSFTSIIT